MLQPSPKHPIEMNIAVITASWDEETNDDHDETIARRQKSMPDMGLASAWNTSHASKHSPRLKAPPSNRSSGGSTIQHCPCCAHSTRSRASSMATTLASPPPSERKAFLHSSTMARRTMREPPAPVQVYSPHTFNAVQLSPELKLSPAEADVLWMLPAMQASPVKTGGHVQSGDNLHESRRKPTMHEYVTKFISASLPLNLRHGVCSEPSVLAQRGCCRNLRTHADIDD